MKSVRSICVCVVLFVVSGLVFAADWQVVYQNDFSTDPGWTTNNSSYNYWDSTGQNYHTKTLSNGGQYVYTPITYVQGNSYKLEFDLSVTNVDYHGGCVLFGLGDSDMARYAPATFYAGYWNSGSGVGRGNVIGQFYSNSEGVSYHPYLDTINFFATNTWYHNVLTYDHTAATLSLAVTRISDGFLMGTKIQTDVGTFSGIDRLYISSIADDGDHGLSGEGYIDNVALYTIPEPATIILFALTGLVIRKKN